MKTIPEVEIMYNYLGQLDRMLGRDSLFRLSERPSGDVIGKQELRYTLIGINAYILRRRLFVSFDYSKNIFDQHRIQSIGDFFLHTLQILIHHCLIPGTGDYTPSDFPEINLNEEDFEKLMEKIDTT
jgi:non-ribosomal peptide synthase protein (TIGR01720 family)